jgi:hypothetical protein
MSEIVITTCRSTPTATRRVTGVLTINRSPCQTYNLSRNLHRRHTYDNIAHYCGNQRSHLCLYRFRVPSQLQEIPHVKGRQIAGGAGGRTENRFREEDPVVHPVRNILGTE